jgi:hypothetical protein
VTDEGAETRERKSFQWLSRATLLLVGVTFSLLLAEAVLRVTGRVPIGAEAELIRFDDRLGWRFRPGARAAAFKLGEYFSDVRINSLGWRDREPGTGSADRRPVLAVLGDSFAANTSVEQAEVFTDLLDQALPRVSVRNFGVNGYGQVQQLLLLEEILDEYRPAAVLVVLYVRNDFDDNLGEFDRDRQYSRPRARLDASGAMVVERDFAPPQEEGLGLQLIRDTAIYHLLQRTSLAWIRQKKLEDQPIHVIPPELRYCQRALAERARVAFRLTVTLLRRMAHMSEERGAHFGIVVAPSRWQVRREYWNALLERFDLDPGAYDRRNPQEVLARGCAWMQRPCLDLLPSLERHADAGENLYYRVDQHWTARGNRRVAEAIEDWLPGTELGAALEDRASLRPEAE